MMSDGLKQAVYTEFEPSPELSPMVRCFWFYDAGDDFDSSSHRVIPDNCADLLFDFSDDARGGKLLCTGMMTRPIFSTRQRLLGVRFNPEQAYNALGIPMKNLTDITCELSDIDKSWENLKRVFDRPFHVSSLEFIRNQLKAVKAHNADRRVRWAVTTLTNSDGNVRIEDIASHLGISRQHLGRLFDKYVGISPKKFARIQRIQAVIRSTQHWINQRSDQILDQTFYDQSHLIRDFRAITGLTPNSYFQPR